MSADPLVPEPIGSQGYDRYAYVLGNPLRYTDPTGLQAEIGPDIDINPYEPYGRDWLVHNYVHYGTPYYDPMIGDITQILLAVAPHLMVSDVITVEFSTMVVNRGGTHPETAQVRGTLMLSIRGSNTAWTVELDRWPDFFEGGFGTPFFKATIFFTNKKEFTLFVLPPSQDAVVPHTLTTPEDPVVLDASMGLPERCWGQIPLSVKLTLFLPSMDTIILSLDPRDFIKGGKRMQDWTEYVEGYPW